MVHRSLKLHIQAFISAFQFLTRLPIPVTVPFHSPVLTRSVVYFPAAGAFIGCCIAISAWALTLVLPPWPAAVILLGIWTALSGGLHLDGWMDTADGVLSHRSRERMLEIMKDSRVGAMGVMAAVLLMLLKAALLAELLEQQKMGLIMIPLLIMIPIWSRAWMATAIAGWPFARQGEGLAILFNGVKGYHAAAAMVAAACISFMALIIYDNNLLFSTMLVLVVFILTLLCGGMLSVWLNNKLGGLTGDTYGAMNEAIEAALLLAAVIWLYAI